MERDVLLKNITILDFMALDLGLYLNTHPDDNEALEVYNQAVVNSDKIKYSYEKQFGPLVSFRSLGEEGWTWEDEPWPWCKSYNFKLSGRE